MVVKPLDEEAIFKVAVEIPAEDARDAYLQQVCGNDEALLNRVLTLLRAHDEAPSFLESPPPALAATANVTGAATALGTQIGPYKLREQIAEGGMGVVYVAEQEEPVRRKVAMKVIKPGMDTKQVIARFEVERQALAVMDHPNVAKVLDAGSTNLGRPYFVMDLVHGSPITDYCDKQKLSPRDRLELFVTVCDAIQHAHQKGIIHRDIKPNNVLVTRNGERAVPKVIDFGVAKAINQRLTERTVYTQLNQLIGTPLYMSPEQAEMSELDVDTRSDVYSLGVLLYELLTGSTPFDQEKLSSVGYDDLRRIIQEQEPSRPSERISTLAAERLSTISDQRSSDPHKLSHTIRGELDWIVMKALEKDRDRRYDTASAMATDIEHFLKDEPVQACPPSTAYRFSKFLRRNKPAIVTALLIVGSLIAGIVGTTWQAYESRRNEKMAEQKAAESQALSDFLVNDLLAAADPYQAKGRKLTVEEVLRNAESRIEGAFEEQPLVEASVRMAMGEAYRALGDYDTAGRHLTRASEIRTRLLGRENGQTLHSMHQRAVALTDQGRYSDAEELHREVLKIRRRIYGNEYADTLESITGLAQSLGHQKQYIEVEKLAREILNVRYRTLGPEHPLTIASINTLTQALIFQDRFSEAEPLNKEALETSQRVLGPQHPETIKSIYLQTHWLYPNERPSEGEKLLRQILEEKRRIYGPAHPSTLDSMQHLANRLDDVGKWEECERLRREVAEVRRRVLGPGHPQTIHSLFTLACPLEGQGKYNEAEQVYAQVLAAWRRMLGPEHPDTLEIMNRLASTLVRQGKFQGARALAQQALYAQRKVLGREHADTLNTQDTLAYPLEGLGRLAEARQLREEVLELASPDDPNMFQFKRGLALNIVLAEDALPDDRQRAIQLAKAAIEFDAEDSESWRAIGVAYAVSGQWQEALEAFELALELGYRDKLVPISILERLPESDDDKQNLRAELLKFLRDNLGESQKNKRSHTNSPSGGEQNSDIELQPTSTNS